MYEAVFLVSECPSGATVSAVLNNKFGKANAQGIMPTSGELRLDLDTTPEPIPVPEFTPLTGLLAAGASFWYLKRRVR